MPPRIHSVVLIVEDDHSACQMYRDALGFAGFRVTVAGDGYDALVEIEATRPAVVVLDLMLPRVAGLDVYRELRAKSATRDIPIVIVTGADIPDPEPTETPFLLRKPIDPDALVATVVTAVRNRHPTELHT